MAKPHSAKELGGYEVGTPGGYLKYLLLLIIAKIGLRQEQIDLKLNDYTNKVIERIHLEVNDSAADVADKIAKAERGRSNLRQLLLNSKSVTFPKLIEACKALGAVQMDVRITLHWPSGRTVSVEAEADLGGFPSSIDGGKEHADQ